MFALRYWLQLLNALFALLWNRCITARHRVWGVNSICCRSDQTNRFMQQLNDFMNNEKKMMRFCCSRKASKSNKKLKTFCACEKSENFSFGNNKQKFHWRLHKRNEKRCAFCFVFFLHLMFARMCEGRQLGRIETSCSRMIRLKFKKNISRQSRKESFYCRKKKLRWKEMKNRTAIHNTHGWCKYLLELHAKARK